MSPKRYTINSRAKKYVKKISMKKQESAKNKKKYSIILLFSFK